MSPERFPRKIEPTVEQITNQPPCTDFITAVPMSAILDLSLHRSHLTLVKTTHGETILKAQKSHIKIGKLQYRSQYRIYSEKGKELVLSHNKWRSQWIITWPNEPYKECRITAYSRYCNAVFSGTSEDSISLGMQYQNAIFTNTATGKVLATVQHKGAWRPKAVLMMEKDIDLVLMTAFIIATAEIKADRDAAIACACIWLAIVLI